MQPPSRPLARSSSTGSNFPRPPQTPDHPASRPVQQVGQQNSKGPRLQPPQHNQPRPQSYQQGNSGQRPGPNNPPQHALPQPQQNQAQNPANGSEPVAFFSARALSKNGEESQGGLVPVAKPDLLFNPKAESPSIRKTPGIDHTTSKPLARTGQHVPPSSQSHDNAEAAGASHGVSRPMNANSAGRPTGPQMGRGNVVNPQLDQTRRIGAPTGGASPLANRGQYRPPTMKRPLPSDAGAAGGRPPLADISSNAPTTNATLNGSGVDAKRQKIG
jgi:DNA repair and recombination protein RAD52